MYSLLPNPHLLLFLTGRAKFSCSDLGYTPIETWLRIYSENGADAGEVKMQAYKKADVGQGMTPAAQQAPAFQHYNPSPSPTSRRNSNAVMPEVIPLVPQIPQVTQTQPAQIQSSREVLPTAPIMEQQLMAQSFILQKPQSTQVLPLQRPPSLQQVIPMAQTYSPQSQQAQYSPHTPIAQAQNSPHSPNNYSATSSSNSPLPSGWRSLVDPAANRTYYVNDVTQATQWARPTVPADYDSPPLAHATLVDPPVAAYTETHLDWEAHERESHLQQHQQQERERLHPSHSHHALVPQNQPQYAAIQQPQYVSQAYQPQQQIPQQPSFSQQQQPSFRPQPYNQTQPSYQTQSSFQLPDRNIPSFISHKHLSPVLDPSDSLPPGWSKKSTPDGKTYYLNHISNMTTWDKP